MESGVGRGRGRGTKVGEGEQLVLRRPHTQIGVSGIPIVDRNAAEHITNPNEVSVKGIPTPATISHNMQAPPNVNCQQGINLVDQNSYASRNTKPNIPATNHGVTMGAFLNSAPTFNMHQGYRVQDPTTAHILASGVLSNSSQNAIVRQFNNYPGGSQAAGNFAVNQLPQNFSGLSINKSNLSADAPVFVPKAASVQVPSQCPAPSFEENVPFQDTDVSGPALPPHALPQVQFYNHPVVLQINNLVMNLTLKPHRFEHIAHQVKSILSWQVKDVNLMKEIITVIFEQGVGEANFRYNGARLCQFISKNMTQSYNGPSFREMLIQRCQEEYNCRELYLQKNLDRLCGFSLFLADIFIHLITASSQYLEKLHSGVCDVLMTLMSQPTNDTLKCVAKVLKGTGHALDSCGGDNMERVMCYLKDVALSAPIGLDVRTLLLSVIELRASNWGRSPSDNVSSAPTDAPLGTVFFGPDGCILKVVSDENDDDSNSDTDDSYFGPCGDEDEEINKAFEEFLRGMQ